MLSSWHWYKPPCAYAGVKILSSLTTESYSLVYIVLRWEILGITTNIDLILRLIYSDIIHPHMCRER